MKAVEDLHRIADALRDKEGLLSGDSIALQNIASHIVSTERYIQQIKNEVRTLRDQFAAAALTGFLSSWDPGNANRIYDMDQIAADAFCMADEMMRTRTPKGEGS